MRGILRSAPRSTARCKGWEVTLRNAMYRGLAEHYGEAWYDNRDAGLDRGAMERIASARTELARDGHGDDAPRIVAALSFGFWVSLLGPGGRIGAGRKANYEMTLLAAGVARGVRAPRDIDPQGGPPAVERLADVAQPDRPSRTVVRARPVTGPRTHCRGGRLDYAWDQEMGGAP